MQANVRVGVGSQSDGKPHSAQLCQWSTGCIVQGILPGTGLRCPVGALWICASHFVGAEPWNTKKRGNRDRIVLPGPFPFPFWVRGSKTKPYDWFQTLCKIWCFAPLQLCYCLAEGLSTSPHMLSYQPCAPAALLCTLAVHHCANGLASLIRIGPLLPAVQVPSKGRDSLIGIDPQCH